MTKKTLIAGLAGLALAGSANALTFNEAQNASFEQLLSVTPSGNNALVFSVAGPLSQFANLSFEFLAVSGLNVSAQTSAYTPGSLVATFNDIKNNSFSLSAGTNYLVKVTGTTTPAIPGNEGTVTVNVLNGAVALVPEPEGYAMFLAGLGLMGVIARRRKI